MGQTVQRIGTASPEPSFAPLVQPARRSPSWSRCANAASALGRISDLPQPARAKSRVTDAGNASPHLSGRERSRAGRTGCGEEAGCQRAKAGRTGCRKEAARSQVNPSARPAEPRPPAAKRPREANEGRSPSLNRGQKMQTASQPMEDPNGRIDAQINPRGCCSFTSD